MIRYLLAAAALLTTISCSADRDVVELEAAGGKLVYSCSSPESRNLGTEELIVLKQYLERLEPVLDARGDVGRAGILRNAREIGDWANLQMLAVAEACAGGPLAYAGPRFPEAGTLAPHFVLALLNDQGTRSLEEARIRGHYAVVAFWATWCAPCLTDYEDLVRLSEEHSDRLQVFHILHRDNPGHARAFIQGQTEGRVINLIDPGETVAREYGVLGLPTTYILDRDGRVLPGCPDCAHRHLTLRDFITELDAGQYQ